MGFDFRVVPVHPGHAVLHKSDSDFMNTKFTDDESWVYGYDPKLVIFLTIKIQREHLTPHSNAVCHQLTLLTDRKNSRMRMKVQGRLMQARFIEIHQVFAKKKSLILF